MPLAVLRNHEGYPGAAMRFPAESPGIQDREPTPRPVRPTVMRISAAFVIVALLGAACGEAGVDLDVGSLPPNTASQPPTEPAVIEPGDRPFPTLERVEPLPAPVTGEVPDDLLALVLEDAAGQSALDIDELVVVRSEFVEWPDGSLGCPEPGMVYTQVPREGLLIRLQAKEHIYSYHGGAGTPPFLCQQATTDTTP